MSTPSLLCLPKMTEGQKKMSKVMALSDAIVRAREELRLNPSWYAGANLQHLKNQRSELQKTMPLTLVRK